MAKTENSWLITDKKEVEQRINMAWNSSMLLFMFGLLGLILKVILLVDGSDLLPELNVVIAMCWIGFFFLHITARYFSIV